jgi:hypothetical protein
MRKINTNKLTLLAALMMMDMHRLGNPKPRTLVEITKRCLHCSNEHKHHNDFCSAKCCKSFRNSELKPQVKVIEAG